MLSQLLYFTLCSINIRSIGEWRIPFVLSQLEDFNFTINQTSTFWGGTSPWNGLPNGLKGVLISILELTFNLKRINIHMYWSQGLIKISCEVKIVSKIVSFFFLQLGWCNSSKLQTWWQSSDNCWYRWAYASMEDWPTAENLGIWDFRHKCE